MSLYIGIIVLLIGCSENSNSSKATTNSIEVSMKVNVNENNGKINISGSTNLPDQTEMMITLYQYDKTYAQDKVRVSKGTFQSDEFSDHGNALHGDFDYEVLMPIASVQPESVKAIIGRNATNLSGSLVVDEPEGRIVKYESFFKMLK